MASALLFAASSSLSKQRKIFHSSQSILVHCGKQGKQVCLQLPTYADNVALHAFARRATAHRQQSIGGQDPQQQTCSSGFAAVVPRWDRQTDRHRTVS